MKVLVTGGCGYIGAHTLVDLVSTGFEVVCLDSNICSDEKILKGVSSITGRVIPNHKVDLCDREALREVFLQNQIDAVIHFAALKQVYESVKKPLLYYQNNINSLLNLLFCVEEFSVSHFIFSSSCSVYGKVESLPVTEETPMEEIESPYANTKKMGEEILRDFYHIFRQKCVLLRYFNPVGAHETGEIGETPFGPPQNLAPIIMQTALGTRDKLVVHGSDYSTRDGTCIRDYIHVMDIAHAHTKALEYSVATKEESFCEVFNLGTGKGVTVLEAIRAFESVSGKKLRYEMGPRREGDVPAIYANNTKAQEKLLWSPERTIEDMMLSAWKWEAKRDK